MKKSYSPEAIVRILQDVQAQLAAGASLREVARQLAVNPGTLCRWQRRYGGVQIDEAREKGYALSGGCFTWRRKTSA